MRGAVAGLGEGRGGLATQTTSTVHPIVFWVMGYPCSALSNRLPQTSESWNLQLYLAAK